MEGINQMLSRGCSILHNYNVHNDYLHCRRNLQICMIKVSLNTKSLVQKVCKMLRLSRLVELKNREIHGP